MKYYINDIIENNKLTLSVSTIVKLITYFDKMIVKCYYNGVPDYIPADHCKFCKSYKEKLKAQDVECRKHYAISLYNNSQTNVSDIFYREERFKLFGRYILRETQNCEFLFYITPYQISQERFVIYALPHGLFNDRSSKYTWTEFRRPGIINFEIDNKQYRVDFTNKYHPRIVEL